MTKREAKALMARVEDWGWRMRAEIVASPWQRNRYFLKVTIDSRVSTDGWTRGAVETFEVNDHAAWDAWEADAWDAIACEGSWC